MGRPKKEPIMVKCPACGIIHEKKGRTDFCSAECKREYTVGFKLPKTCKACGRVFHPDKSGKRYCPECLANGRKFIPPKKEKPKSISEMAREARSFGMTYGKYVESLERGIL